VAVTKKSSSKRKTPNLVETMLGAQGLTSAFATDMFTNFAARQGYGTPSLGQGAEYNMVRLSYDYWLLITLFRNHWISRRIVEVPAQDMVKAWPKLTSDIEPKDLTKLDRALRKTNAKNNLLTAMVWARLFGGAGALMVIDGQDDQLDEPLDLESVGIGTFKGLIPFDRWAGISPQGDVCTDIDRPLDFNKPEMYEVRVTGGDSFKVHSSRLLRFLGPTVPTPELEAQSYWGISVLEPTYESITKLDNMSWNILGLTFRANLLGIEFPQLEQILSGVGGTQAANKKMEERLSAVNQMMSNQSLIPLAKDGKLEATSYSFGGLAEIFQLFQLDLSGAAQIPVTRLFGRTYTGLGQAGDGDERIYEEKISTDQAVYMVPQLEKMYPVVCMSELGEVPDDLDLICPSIRVLDEKEKSELAKSVADTLTVYQNGGIMSPRTVGKEVKQSSDMTGIGTNITDEDLQKLSDKVQSEGEMGEGLFGGEANTGLSAASGPGKALKEEDKEAKTSSLAEVPGDEDDVPPVGKKPTKDELLSKIAAVRARLGTAPAMGALPSNLKAGSTVEVNGKPLVVKKVTTGTKDLFGDPTVQVQFETGEIIAYRPDSDVRANDAHITKAQIEAVRRKHSIMMSANHDLTWEAAKPVLLRGFGEEAVQAYEAKYPWSVKATDADSPSTKHEGMMLYHALPVRIETPKGGVRSGPGWSHVLPADYGFIDNVPAADGDNLDCYVGPEPESNDAYVVDQLKLDGKSFDEHKVVLGCSTPESAEELYRAGHHLSDRVFGAITRFSMPMFRRWMATHDMTQPCSPDVEVRPWV
jgi:phage-related protein (TIGR01555 family)